jgi:ankyrin repeat protein
VSTKNKVIVRKTAADSLLGGIEHTMKRIPSLFSQIAGLTLVGFVLCSLTSCGRKNGTSTSGNVAPGQIFVSAQNGDFETVKSLLKVNPELVRSRDKVGSTPLHRAAQEGGMALVKLLLASGADVNAQDNYGNTPLHEAALNGHKEVVALLLTCKADFNARNKNGETPLHRAAMTGHNDVAELLLANGADVNAKDNGSTTPLQLAVVNGRQDMVELLRQHGGHE